MIRDVYQRTVRDLDDRYRDRTTVVPDAGALHANIAKEFADLLQAKAERGEILTIIAPVGPLDYRIFVDEVNRRGLSCRNLRVVNMDEYLTDAGEYIPESHPLSFRRFMEETFYGHLAPDQRPLPENILFPDPRHPSETTRLLEEIGGADSCWAGFGLSGHVAFNDPPGMLGEPDDLQSFRSSKTRILTVSAVSRAQMVMGGSNGNWEIVPTRAVTVGMHEILQSRTLHLTFMRSWHAGLWRRALFGPITQTFPGSLVQDHPDLKITMTEIAARPPAINTAQARGEEES